VGAGGVSASPLPPPPSPSSYFPTDPWIFRYKTTVIVIVFLCVPDFFYEDGDRRASLSGGTKEKDDLTSVSNSSWPCSPEFIYQRRYMSRILALDLSPVPIFMKQICAKRLALKLILFESLSQTSLLAYFSVYLTLLKLYFLRNLFEAFPFHMIRGRGEIVSSQMEIIKTRK
jgi:hypothetical protein